MKEGHDGIDSDGDSYDTSYGDEDFEVRFPS